MIQYTTKPYIKKGIRYYRCYVNTGSYRDDGRPKIIETYGKTKKEAQAKMKVKLEQGIEIVQNRNSSEHYLFSEWIRYYWSSLVPPGNLRQTTQDLYERVYENHIKPYFKGYSLQGVTGERLQIFVNDLIRKNGCSPSTVRTVMNVVRIPLKKAVDLGKLSKNPCDFVELPRMKQKDVSALRPEEFAKLGEVLREGVMTTKKIAVLLMLDTGMRRGEVLALRWDNVNLLERTIYICENYVRTKAGLLIQSPKTENSIRQVALSEATCQLLSMRREMHRNDVYVIRQEKQDKPIAPDNFSRWYRTLCKKAGIQERGVHRLRHSYATIAFAAGLSPKLTQEQLGHSNLRTTLRTYTHTSIEQRVIANNTIHNHVTKALAGDKEEAGIVLNHSDSGKS